MLDRLPPHSTEAEQGVLGCILLDPPNSLPVCLDQIKCAEVFYDLRHQQIFRVCAEMFHNAEPVDIITLQQRLKDRNHLESAGGLAYLATLPDATPSAANLSFYLEILQEKYALREFIRTCTEGTLQAYEDHPSVEEFIDRATGEILRAAERTARTDDTPILEYVRQAIDSLDEYHKSNGQPIGLPTGFHDLDKMLRGLHPGELTIIAARPGCGKSSLAMNLVDHIALEKNVPVAVFSLEMKGASLVERVMCSRARINGRRLADGKFVNSDFPKLTAIGREICRSKIHIVDESSLSILQLKAKARRLVQRHEIKLIIVDYIQLLHSTSKKAENRRLEIGEISRGLKTLAMDLNIPVVALSQLNRELEKNQGRKPRLCDLRESGDLEQDADAVWLLYRPSDEEEDTSYGSEPYRVNLIVAKQRNGPIGEVPLMFRPEFTRFENAIIEFKSAAA